MELYCKWSCFCSIRYLLLIGIHVIVSNGTFYSEDDVYTTNSTTNYSKIPTDCTLFGSKFGSDYSGFKILNTTETLTYWVGAKIGFKRNINPLGVVSKCNGTKSGSLDECDSRCKGWKYFCYNETSCSCSNYDNKNYDGLAFTQICGNPENGLCDLRNMVLVYERDVDVLNKDYKCGAYQFIEQVDSWIFKTRNCSERIGFICDGDKPDVAQVRSSWLAAEHTCSKRDKDLLQPSTKTLGNKIKDGTIYWVSSFRQKKISWGEDFSNTVCVAAKILPNGNYRLESHFCNESLEALCHKPDRTTYGSSKSDIMTASLGTALGGVLVCITVVAVAIKNRRY